MSESDLEISLLTGYVTLDFTLSDLSFLLILNKHITRLTIIYICFSLYGVLDLTIDFHLGGSFPLPLCLLVLPQFFELVRGHRVKSLLSGSFLLLVGHEILARIGHHHEDLWPHEHILDTILVVALLAIVYAIIVFDCLRVEQHELIDGVDCEPT